MHVGRRVDDAGPRCFGHQKVGAVWGVEMLSAKGDPDEAQGVSWNFATTP